MAAFFVFLAFSGCASYRNVAVFVVREASRVPIAGVTVATVYTPKPFSLAARKQDRAVTNSRGLAFLRANYLRHEPTLFGFSRPFMPAYCISQSFATITLIPGCDETEPIFRQGKTEISSVEFSIEDERLIKMPKNIFHGVVTHGGGCTQPARPAQMKSDLLKAWAFIAYPFRRPFRCGGVVGE